MEKLLCKRTFFGLLLFLSLAGNLFLGGLLLGHRAGPNLLATRAALLSSVDKLSPASRDRAKAILRADMPPIRQKLAALQAERQTLRTLLAAPDYSHDRAAALMKQIRTDVATAQAMAQDMMLKIVDSVTPAERAALASSLPKRFE